MGHIFNQNVARAAMVSAVLLSVSGCGSVDRFRPGDAGPFPLVQGPGVTASVTPMDKALACVGEELEQSRSTGSQRIAVGKISDQTGKFTEGDGGAVVTQGASLMMISALGKLGSRVKQVERYDTGVADQELLYISQRYLGDGREHRIIDADGSERRVDWLPYEGGTLRTSDYYIVGGISEINFNIYSGGAEARVGATGPRARIYAISVAVDLRIVDTRTLEIVRTVTLQKQVVGYEVGFEIFRFFGDRLFDINTGSKSQEPLQLAVRTMMELAAVELVSPVWGIDPSACLELTEWGTGSPVAGPEPEEPEPESVQQGIGSRPGRPDLHIADDPTAGLY